MREKKSITRTGQDRTTKKSQKRNISHIWGEAPRKDIAMKFGTGVDVLDVVTVAEFDLENLRGVNITGVKIWASPLTLPTHSVALLRYL